MGLRRVPKHECGASWSEVNCGLSINGTFVQALAINPATPTTLYAGLARGATLGGVFKSTNSGGCWNPVNDGLTDLDVQALVIDPTAPGRVYAGTSSGGVFQSTNAGAGWIAVNPGLTNRSILALGIDPTGSTSIYAGTAGDGVFKLSLAGPSPAIRKTGNGGGSVTSVLAGIDCGADCWESYTAATSVTLTAVADPGSVLSGWNGCAAVIGVSCTVSMTADRSVTATFIPLFTLAVTRTGSGSGNVTGPAINCGPDCSEALPSGTVVSLTAIPAVGAVFAGWGGACSGTGTCNLALVSHTVVTATFVGVPSMSGADFDGDGISDISVFRQSAGTWHILRSTTGHTGGDGYAWGANTDVPVPGDYDGDGRVDIAVYRPSSGHWFILKSSSDYVESLTYQWGTSGDIPVANDYDGDDRTDLAIYRPFTGTWYILKSSTGYTVGDAYAWGGSTDASVPGDYDGDGKCDVAVYRFSSGHWFVLTSTTNYATPATYQWGTAGDLPVPGDYDGDNKQDLAIYRPSIGTWYVLTSSSEFTDGFGYVWG
jgi:hypothetical protein